MMYIVRVSGSVIAKLSNIASQNTPATAKPLADAARAHHLYQP
jgi:hypothetical protein